MHDLCGAPNQLNARNLNLERGQVLWTFPMYHVTTFLASNGEGKEDIGMFNVGNGTVMEGIKHIHTALKNLLQLHISPTYNRLTLLMPFFTPSHFVWSGVTCKEICMISEEIADKESCL